MAASGLLLALAFSFVKTPLYRSSVTLQVNPPTVEVLDEQTAQVTEAVRFQDLVATNVGLLESRTVAERAAQELNLANNPDFAGEAGDPRTRLRSATDKVRQGLTVVPPKVGQLIEFSFVSESPELAARVPNAIAEALINSSIERRYESSAYARNFLQRQIAKTRTELERSERQLVSYAQREGIVGSKSGDGGSDGGDPASPEGQSLMSLNQALANATASRVSAEGAYRAALASGPTSEETASSQALRQSKAALEAEFEDKRTLLKPNHPELVRLRSRIDEVNRHIAQETATVSSGRTNTLRAQYSAALAAERALQSRVAQLKSAVLDLRGRSIQYAILQRDVDTNRALYDALLQRYKEIGVAGGIGTAPLSIVDRAERPSRPFSPNVLLNVLIGLGTGLLAGILSAIVLEFLNDTIKTRSDVRDKLKLACLGVIPKQPRKQSFVDELRDPSSTISEAYASVVASLRFTTDDGVPKTLLITSARPSEGKSSSVLALACNFARQGKSVLLIDADLRQPVFKAISENRGLTNLLTTHEAVADYVTPTAFEGLSLLPAGPTAPNPADLLSTGRFRQILREASEHFDIIIIDAPPVLSLADTALLASASRHVMFVVESGKTRTAAAVEALHRLSQAGADVVGATLTKATEETATYGYGYGYGYRYGKVDNKRKEPILLGPQARLGA